MKSNISCVYWIENIKNGKKYVGSTLNYRKRCTKHRSELKNGYHHNKNLQEDYNVYGIEAFNYVILHRLDTENELRDKEQEYIDKLIESNKAYNISELSTSPSLPGSKNPMYGKVGHWKGKKMPESARKNMSEGAKGKKMSNEARENMSKARKGKQKGKDNPMYGYKWSEEQLERKRIASTGRIQTYENKCKMLWTKCKLRPDDIIKMHYDIKDKSIKKVHNSKEYDLSYGMLHSIQKGYHWVLEEYFKTK